MRHDIALILEWFDYDPIRGILIRRKKTRSDAYDEINWCQTVKFQGSAYPYAVLCWAIYNGKWPPDGYWVDHKDQVKLHNWIDNLRLATPTQNQQNKAGYGGIYPKGVTFRLDGSRKHPYQARIRVNGTRILLGSFKTAEEAAEAYRQAAILHHGEFACLE
jgi:hypothetical protein